MFSGLENILIRISEIQDKFIKLHNLVRRRNIPEQIQNFDNILQKKLDTLSQQNKIYSNNDNINSLIVNIANKYNVDPRLINAIIKVESNYNIKAVSPKGAVGLMQLMPKTAKELGIVNIFNPEENIEGGVRYLKRLLEEFKDLKLALAAYNAGPEAVKMYNNQIPPFKETRDYVKKVLEYYQSNQGG